MFTLCCSLFSCLVVFDSSWPHGLQHSRLPCFPISQSLLKFMSIESMMPPNQLVLCCPLLLLPSIFPSIRVFSNESVLRIKWPKYWTFSFSISPSAIFPWIFRVDFFQDWLVWSPSCPSDSKESFPTSQFKSTNSLAHNYFYGPTLTHIHTWLLEKQ